LSGKKLYVSSPDPSGSHTLGILGWHYGSIREVADENQSEYYQWKGEYSDGWSQFFGNDASEEDQEEDVDR